MLSMPDILQVAKTQPKYVIRETKYYCYIKEIKHSNEMNPKTFCYAYRSVPHSTIIREAPSCSIWELTLRPKIGHVQSMKNFISLSPNNGTSVSILPFQASGSYAEKEMGGF